MEHFDDGTETDAATMTPDMNGYIISVIDCSTEYSDRKSAEQALQDWAGTLGFSVGVSEIPSSLSLDVNSSCFGTQVFNSSIKRNVTHITCGRGQMKQRYKSNGREGLVKKVTKSRRSYSKKIKCPFRYPLIIVHIFFIYKRHLLQV